MIRWLPLAALTVPVVLVAQQTPAPGSLGVEAWRDDLRTLATELPARHPNAFANIPRTRWDSAVTALDARLPGLRPDQAVVEFLRLVALLGDAHTVVEWTGPGLGDRRAYPVELYRFEDGLFVRRAAPDQAALLGARVLRIGGVTADSALALAAPLVSHENEWWVRAWAPRLLTTDVVARGLGLADAWGRLGLELERDGRREPVTLTAVERPAGGHGPDAWMAGWPTMRTGPVPLREAEAHRPFRWTWLPESGTLYVAYRAVAFAFHGQTNRQFWDEVFAQADTLPVKHFVIDIRENTGGNGFLNRYPVQQILRRPALDRPDVLAVIIGRRTFSAAQQLANDLDWWTQATFVGEPTGQRPSQYGDHRPLALPRTGLVVNVSSVFHQGPNPMDRRRFIAPEVYAPLRAADYRAGRDPALAAAMTMGEGPSLGDRMEAMALRGDTAGAAGVLAEARAAEVNRFRNLEAEVNALGYRLLNGHRIGEAIAIFAINTRAFPGSANTFDSLGEALLAAGRREESIAAYRHALTIDPGFAPSREALERMGVPPAPPPG